MYELLLSHYRKVQYTAPNLLLTIQCYQAFMTALRLVDELGGAAKPGGHRVAGRSRVLMQGKIRLRGSEFSHPVTIRDMSSTGLRAKSAARFLPGANVELELPNLGWVTSKVVWVDDEGSLGVRFSAIIQPERTHSSITGSYRKAPSGLGPQLRRV